MSTILKQLWDDVRTLKLWREETNFIKQLRRDKELHVKRLLHCLSYFAIALCLMLIWKGIIRLGLIEMKAEVGAWEIFFAVFGVMYAIVAGLLLLETLGRFNDLATTIQNEVNNIEYICYFVHHIDKPNGMKTELCEALHGYVNSILKCEWEEMRKAEESATAMELGTPPQLNAIMTALKKTDVIEKDRIAPLIVDKIGETISYRRKRLDLAQRALHPAKQFVLIFMSAMLAGTFLLMLVDPLVHVLMVFAIVVALHVLYTVISDLNRPFTGLWVIDNKPFERLLQRLEGDLNSHLGSDRGRAFIP